MFGFVSVEVFNPSAFWELHSTILSRREGGKIFQCPAPSHLEGFPSAREASIDTISNYACSPPLRVLLFLTLFCFALLENMRGLTTKMLALSFPEV